ncbi:hypothetical protein EUTSA_v10005806mg [Eutrema salsugineum]|uniref:DUF4408 domain-containing protein n=1 Tax=Eutrema salsugineum TaxID=72664 RepID=V4L198_EUTSA|nr:enolase-phosphatase E1 [Eutrema salsugineum]ESQ44040.1 hypothetical protein EUTSA_v10005806mg [Eutrema salsugineum]
MSSPNPYSKRRSPPSVSPAQPRSKSTGGFFCKSVLFALFLLALPLFPSQAPDFVGETVLTKFWELIHLLFVGIAVAYGLFSRRNVESAVDLRMSRVDESSLSYVSRIFQVSSVFDEELGENSCDFVDVRSESHSINVSSRDSVVVRERKSESFAVETESEESCEYGKISQVQQAWNSQYFQGRSKVVVARPAYGLDGHVVHQPLGLPVRSLRSALRDNAAPEDDSFSDTCDGTVNGEADESLADENFDEVMPAPPSPVSWQSRPEMMGMGENYPSNFQPPSVDETQFEKTLKSRSSRSTVSSSSQTSFASHTQNRFSPSRSVSEESLNLNVDESAKEKSLQGSSRSTSPSLPPSPSLSLSLTPPSPELVADDTHRRVSHSRHYSDGSLLEEDVIRRGFENELEVKKVRGRRTEFSSRKETGSKSLKLTAESSRRGNKSRRSYPPESISSPVGGAASSTTRRRDLQRKSDDHLFEDNIGKRLEADHSKLRVKKGRSHDSLELTAEDSAKDENFSESFPALDVLFQPTNAKASRRAMHSSRGERDTLPEKDITRNTEDDSVDKSRQKDHPGSNKELESNSPRRESHSLRASTKASLRGKSVRTIRSDRRGKDLKTDGGDSSDDRAEAKVESRGRTKTRRKWQEELSIVPHQEKFSETLGKSEAEDDNVREETEAEQPQVTLEEEEAAWESQSNASHDHNEVDRKAGEFIAKFREQIRLQKLTSGEQPRGGVTGIIRNSHFR